MTSTVLAIFASSAGWRNTLHVTSWPMRTRLVSRASAAVVVQHSKRNSCDASFPEKSPGQRTSEIQRASKPSCSAVWAACVMVSYTTMEMVAAQAGVSIMTLYRHFRGKDVLFQAVIQHLCSQKAKEGREMFWQGHPAEVLHRLGQLRLAYPLNAEEIALFQVILGAMEHFPEVGQMYYHLSVEKALDRLSMYFQELDRQGSFHIPDPHFSAQAFLTLLQGQIIERARLGAGPAPTSEEIKQIGRA